MIKRLLFLFFLLLFNRVAAQDREASILFHDNSSVKGFGEIKNNKIYFRLTLTEKPEIWTEEDAKGIEFKGYRLPEKYVYVIYEKNDNAQLMEVVEEGPVELYKDTYILTQYTNLSAPRPFGATVKESKIMDYYIKKASTQKAIEVNMDFKNMGKTLFSDCEDLMYKINEEEFYEIEEIIDLVKFYNHNCGK